MTEHDDATIGDPIPDVFPPDDAVARFVVSMSMANNDIDRSLRDLLRAAENDEAGFASRVRVVIGFLVEAIDALGYYSQHVPEVPKLLKRLPADARTQLKVVRRTLQDAGPKALQDARDSTFHFPSPNPDYVVTSDEKLGKAIAGLAHIGCNAHYDGDTRAVTLDFADQIAFNLAMGDPNLSNDEAFRRSAVARDGALAFINWATALLRLYMKDKGHNWGEPTISTKAKSPGTVAAEDEPS